MHEALEHSNYDSMQQMWTHFGVESEQHYIDILQAGVSRPCIVDSHSVGQKWVHPFTPWIASILDSNMDLQVILDYYA
ncbi:hypothetical protein HPB49_003638 [Dermacentor silvarum]|uniref:Uncharacterized protein n=1 Tax=Dermacentor silvarum TaxID=543639 RepID=A0ACB8CPN3_DERSI|nr:hypothetical protein HPB49_003638 [Dermacentor silvarum]